MDRVIRGLHHIVVIDANLDLYVRPNVFPYCLEQSTVQLESSETLKNVCAKSYTSFELNFIYIYE